MGESRLDLVALALVGALTAGCATRDALPPTSAPPSAPAEHPTVTLIRSIPVAVAVEGGYSLRITNLQQRPWTDDAGLALEVQTAFETPEVVELVARHPRITRCRTADGTSLVGSDPPYLSVLYPGAVLAGAVVIGTERDRLAELEITCTALAIEERTVHVAESVPAGRTDSLILGGCRVTITGEPTACWVATSAAHARDTTGSFPPYSHTWSRGQMLVTDARGARLVSIGGMSTGGSSTGMFVHPDRPEAGGSTPDAAVIYPVRIEFAEPTRVTEHPLTFRWTDLPLPPANDGR